MQMSILDPRPLVAVAAREVRRVATSPLQLALMAVLPPLSAWWLLAIFAHPLPRDLPMTLVDLDRGSLAGTVAQMIDDTPAIRIAGEVASVDDAARRIRRGQSFGVIVVPHGFGADVVGGRAPTISVFYNTQWLLGASLIARDVQAAVLTASAGAEVAAARRRGTPRAEIAPRVEPVATRVHTLHNPHLSYHYSLLAALFPAILQMFAGMAMAIGLGSEFKDDTVAAWLTAARGSLLRAFAGKAMVHSAWFTLLAVAMLGIVFGRLETPLRGRVAVLVLGSWLFITAVQAVACALVALTGGLRLAVSLVAFYTGIAFPFIGVTFPTMAMPLLARAWGECLPLTHFVRLLIDHSVRGTLPGHDARVVLVLAGITAGALLVSSWPLRRLVHGTRAWQVS